MSLILRTRTISTLEGILSFVNLKKCLYYLIDACLMSSKLIVSTSFNLIFWAYSAGSNEAEQRRVAWKCLKLLLIASPGNVLFLTAFLAFILIDCVW